MFKKTTICLISLFTINAKLYGMNIQTTTSDKYKKPVTEISELFQQLELKNQHLTLENQQLVNKASLDIVKLENRLKASEELRDEAKSVAENLRREMQEKEKIIQERDQAIAQMEQTMASKNRVLELRSKNVSSMKEKMSLLIQRNSKLEEDILEAKMAIFELREKNELLQMELEEKNIILEKQRKELIKGNIKLKTDQNVVEAITEKLKNEVTEAQNCSMSESTGTNSENEELEEKQE